jgi:hypothetical protein
VRIAGEILPGFNYTPGQIEVVRWAILSTILPQLPQNPIERVLTDADLDILGSDNFFPRNNDLRRELANLGREYSDEAWYQSQVKFLENHHYFTESARTLRNIKKEANFAELKKLLEKATAQKV